jgi:replicative DNA helicase
MEKLQNIPAERIVLGYIMRSHNSFEESIEKVKDQYFVDPRHQVIFNLLVHLYNQGSTIDENVILMELFDRDLVQKAGGEDYVISLIEDVIAVRDIEYHINVLQEKYLLRGIFQISEELHTSAKDASIDVQTLLDEAETRFSDLANQQSMEEFADVRHEMNQLMTKITEISKSDGSITGIDTGFTQLNDMTAGFQPGDLIILGARPSMGKTAFALNLVENMIKLKNKPSIAFFSLEMGTQSLLQRMLSAESGVRSDHIRTGKLDNEEWALINAASSTLAKTNLYIDDTPGITVNQLRTKARKLNREKNLDAIFIDYLQLIHGNGKSESRQQEVSLISRSLKALARELELPVIALSQLSRNLEQRGANDRRPMLSDLRESGSIEQDADVIMFLYREEYYIHDKEQINGSEKEGLTEVIIGKQRNGPVGTVKLRFEKEINKFYTISYLDEE